MLNQQVEKALSVFEDLELAATTSFGSHLVFFSANVTNGKISSRSCALSSFSATVTEIDDSLLEQETLPRLMLRMLRSNRYDSSGWFSLLFCTKLIRFAVQRAIPLWSLKTGYLAAMNACLILLQETSTWVSQNQKHIQKLALPLSWLHVEHVVTVVETSLNTFNVLSLRKDELRSLAINLVSAVTTSLNGTGTGSNIFFKQLPGLPYSKTTTMKNALVMDIPIPPEMAITMIPTNDKRKQYPGSGSLSSFSRAKQYERLVVALFESSVELPQYSGVEFEVAGDADTQSGAGADTGSAKQVEIEYFKAVAQYLKKSGVTMVACQRRVHPYLRRLLSKMDILCVQRLSIRFIGALQRLSGAKQLGCIPASATSGHLDESLLGYLSRVSAETIFGKKMLVAWSSSPDTSNCPDRDDDTDTNDDDDDERDRRVMTALRGESFAQSVLSRRMRTSSMIVTAPSDALCQELQRALEEAARTLSACLVCPYVLPGAGLWQAAVARSVSQQLLHPPQSSLPIKAPIQSLDAFGLASALSSSSSLPSTTTKFIDRNVRCAVEAFADALNDCSRIIGNMPCHPNEACVLYSSDTDTLDILADTGISSHVGEVPPVEMKFCNPWRNCTVTAAIDHGTNTDGLAAAEPPTIRIDHADALEPLSICRTALELAVETALCVLDVDGEVISHPVEIDKSRPS